MEDSVSDLRSSVREVFALVGGCTTLSQLCATITSGWRPRGSRLCTHSMTYVGSVDIVMILRLNQLWLR